MKHITNFKLKKGSTIVEAALIYPLLILVTAGLISIGIQRYSKVKEESIEDSEEIEEKLKEEDFLSIGMKIRWFFL